MQTDLAEQRFQEIYQQHQRHVLAYFLRRTDLVNAQTGAAETFRAVARSLDRISDRANTLPWIYSVAHRVLARQLRAQRRRPPFRRARAIALEREVVPAEAVVVRRADDAAVLEALSELPPIDREIILLSAWEELPPEQIGRVVGKSARAVTQCLDRVSRDMANHLAVSNDLVVERLRAINQVPDPSLIGAHALAALATALEQARVEPTGPDDLVRVRSSSGWRIRLGVALICALVLAAALMGVVSLTTGAEQTPSESATPPTIVAGPTQRPWSGTLATTRAGGVPAPTLCASDPIAGPVEQERPGSGWSGSLSAAFDPQRGRILYIDARLETWAFDVCVNTWTNLNPDRAPMTHASGGLVYDVDSDVAIALGHEIAVFDPDQNAWHYPDAGNPDGPGDPFGGVYDPVSGLVVTTVYPAGGGRGGRVEAWAYDVDQNEWLPLGVIAAESEDSPWQYDLIGYVPALDRLIFTPSAVGVVDHTMLIDPRSGAREVIWIPTPAISLRWPEAHYGLGNGTTYVAGVELDESVSAGGSGGLICGFDAGSLSWSQCYEGPSRPVFGPFRWFGAMVGDPINDQLVLIGGLYGEFGAMSTSHVWGIDYNTGSIVELVPDLP